MVMMIPFPIHVSIQNKEFEYSEKLLILLYALV